MNSIRFAVGLAIAGSFMSACPVLGDTIITPFEDFSSDTLYASWTNGTIVSGPISYCVTASGYGSNWKYLPLSADPYETEVELSVTLSGGGSGFLGPIITLVDTSLREFNFPWYGRTLGSHVLTNSLNSPTWRTGPSGPLDIANLKGIHMQLDPSSYDGSYTVCWENLRLVGSTNKVGTNLVAYTFTSGGVSATDGQFMLTASSIGGLTVGRWRDAAFSINGGELVPLIEAGPVFLQTRRVGNELRLIWNATGCVLEEAPSPSPSVTWTNVPGGDAGYFPALLGNDQRFFRLRCN